ncbi:hypothetical protein [uncultured Paracoccus sp.]|uniref:hypothetical protein n=1 Tax=uncultured Paracoccus sp. TaxID=189685 RepID=UPI00262B1A09|nr:hypothetical protein [uncultured Paracoccus sp.]
MTASDRTAGPDLGFDPAKHPRIVEMAEAIRKGRATFRALTGAGFAATEIAKLYEPARSLAQSLPTEQAKHFADRLSEMIDKANAAIPAHMPMPKGLRETQAMVVAWNRYCLARDAYRLDAWEGQRERCAKLLKAFLVQTPAGPSTIDYLMAECMKTMGARH